MSLAMPKTYLPAYWALFKTSWNASLIYRFNFFMWRFRQLLLLLTTYFFWTTFFTQTPTVFGYQKAQLVTYLLGTAVLNALVLGSRSVDLAGIINRGDLSLYLLKPLGLFRYWLVRDLADKLLNLLFLSLELGILLLFLRPPLYLPSSPSLVLLSLLAAVLSLFLYFYLNLIFSTLGFWTPQVWAPRFLLMIILQFAAGRFFPLDILPPTVFRLFRLTPFPYLIYFPLAVFLGRLSPPQLFAGFLLSFFWTVAFYLLARFLWQQGLKIYASEGR